MANMISGKVIAVSPVQTVASTDASKQPLMKRSIYMDCTRFDQYTGERSTYENMPVLEFTGEKLLEKVKSKLDAIKKGDIVTVFFDVQGTSYKDKATGKTRNYTGIRAYDVQIKRTADGKAVEPQPQPQQAQAPAPAPQYEPAPQVQSPFVGEDNGDLPF